MTDSNPVLVEVTRGGHVESRHRGAIAVVDADGGVHTSIGDTDRPVFPRSAVKLIQALPLVESGAADAFDMTGSELALAASSHNAESLHVETARQMLTRAGVAEGALECGSHWASRPEHMRAQARLYDTLPPAICNNCSGKHTGFLCTAAHLGINPTGYTERGHPVQEAVRQTMQSVTGVAHDSAPCGFDGCSIPTYAVPLHALANGFARMATGIGLTPGRAKAAQRLMMASMENPFLVAGSGRFCTDVMTAAAGTVYVKTGAEGVFCAALPTLGLGVALKCDDGSTRGAEAIMAGVLSLLIPASNSMSTESLSGALSAFNGVELRNCNQFDVGSVRAVFSDALNR